MIKAKKGLTESQFGFLLILPALIVFGFIILYPFINSLFMSLTDRSLLYPGSHFIGLKNFIKLLNNPNIRDVFKNTLFFVAGTTSVAFIFGFIWAIILNQGFKGSEILRGITLVNWIIPGTAIGFLWMWMFNGQYGVRNSLLKHLGLIKNNISWLGFPNTAMLGVILARAWQVLPWNMAFLLAGLQGIPRQQVEAARIDGAGNIRVFTKVILPNMKFIIFFVLILGAIGNLQQFTVVWAMTQGGPGLSTTTLALEVYKSAFQNWDLGMAAAIGVVWVLIVSIFAYFYLKNLESR